MEGRQGWLDGEGKELRDMGDKGEPPFPCVGEKEEKHA